MKRTFRGGVHPLPKIHEGKSITDNKAIEIMPAPKELIIPMNQAIGAPAAPVVEVGESVYMGQKIGEAKGFVSAPVHSSVSGIVKKIGKTLNLSGKQVEAVVIENDFEDRENPDYAADYRSMSREDIIEHIKASGIVGMGGATFPTHVKLTLPPGKSCELLIINGAECEPFLTSDYRMMVEHPHRILNGVKIAMTALNVKRAVIGIEDNKPGAAKVLSEAIDLNSIKVAFVETKYPQGSEKQLIEVVAGREVPSGKLPIDAGVVVINVSTAAAIADAFLRGKPLYERVVTATGALNKPGNYLVRVGTPTSDLIEHCGGYSSEPLKIISGGPMMGLPIPDLSCAITKGYGGLLVLDSEYTKKERRTNCIRCAKCHYACPIRLKPAGISAKAEQNDFEAARALHAADCISCGCCSFVCPAKIPLAQNIKLAKDQIAILRMKEKIQAQQAD